MNPIGIFDSGVGGLTVFNQIIKILPSEDIIYFGDTARVPYGIKSKETVIKFSIEIADFLIKKDVKIIVIACNTASSYALRTLEKKYKIPVIGVIKPTVKSIINNNKLKSIGIIGTEATINSREFEKEIFKYNKKIETYSVACPLFVPLVEEMLLDNKITFDVIDLYLQGFQNKKIDALILGCTHYPLLKSSIDKYFNHKIKLIDTAFSVANEVKDTLQKKNMLKSSPHPPEYTFYVSDHPKRFKKLARLFLGFEIKNIKLVRL